MHNMTMAGSEGKIRQSETNEDAVLTSYPLPITGEGEGEGKQNR